MVSSYCSLKLQEASLLIRFQPLFTLFFCVLNFLFALVATVSNLLVICALWKASSIPSNLKKLLLNLAFSDLAVGSFVQPMFSIVMAVMLSTNSSDFDYFCPAIITVTLFCVYFLAGVSFLTIAAIAFDRFLAVTLHLRYQSLVTDKRVRVGLVFLWLTTALTAFAVIASHSHNNIGIVAVQSVGFAVITVAYLRIYKVLRRHRNQIYSQRQIHNDQVPIRAAREKKSALNSFYVYITSLVCYLPSTCCFVLLQVNHLEISYISTGYVAFFLVFLSSSLNPLVYCWRYSEIRDNVKRTVKKICRANNHMAQYHHEHIPGLPLWGALHYTNY